MLTGLILKTIGLFFSILIFILPNWQIPDQTTTNLTILWKVLLGFNNYFPIMEILTVFLIIFGFEILILFTRWVLGLASLARGGGKIDF